MNLNASHSDIENIIRTYDLLSYECINPHYYHHYHHRHYQYLFIQYYVFSVHTIINLPQ